MARTWVTQDKFPFDKTLKKVTQCVRCGRIKVRPSTRMIVLPQGHCWSLRCVLWYYLPGIELRLRHLGLFRRG